MQILIWIIHHQYLKQVVEKEEHLERKTEAGEKDKEKHLERKKKANEKREGKEKLKKTKKKEGEKQEKIIR